MMDEKAGKGTQGDEGCNPEPAPSRFRARSGDRRAGRGMRNASTRHTWVRTDGRELKGCGVDYGRVVRGLERISRGRHAVLGLDRDQEAVAAARESLDVARLFRVVRERDANLVDREIDAMFKIDEGGIGPEMEPNFFARNDRAGAFGEKLKQAEGLRLQSDESAIFAKLTGRWVEFKRTEAHPGRGGRHESVLPEPENTEWGDSNNIAGLIARTFKKPSMTNKARIFTEVRANQQLTGYVPRHH